MEPGEYDHQAVEAAARALWETHDVYRYDRAGYGPVFSVDTPPPYRVGGAPARGPRDELLATRLHRAVPADAGRAGVLPDRVRRQRAAHRTVRRASLRRAGGGHAAGRVRRAVPGRDPAHGRNVRGPVAAAGPVAGLVAALLDHRRPLPADRPDQLRHPVPGGLPAPGAGPDPVVPGGPDLAGPGGRGGPGADQQAAHHQVRRRAGPPDRDHPARAAAGLRGAVPPSRRYPLPGAHHGAGAAVRLRGAGTGRPGRGPGVRHRADDGVHVRRQRGRAAVAARPPGAAAGGGAGRAPGRAGGTVRRADRDPGAFGHRQGARRGRAAGRPACRSGRWSGCTSAARPRSSSRSGPSGSSRCASTPTGSGPARPSWSGSRRSCGGGWRTGSTGSSGTGTSPGSGGTGCRSRSGSAPRATRRSWPGSRTCRSTRSPTSRRRRPARAAVTAS